MSTPGPAVLAVGSHRNDPSCLDGTVLAPGVHLLWTVAPGLGYPVGGYDVARRPRQPPAGIEATGPGAVLARHTADATAGGWSAELWATGVTGARITGDDLVICTLDFGRPALWEGWRPLTKLPILLPLVPPGGRNRLE